MKNMIFTLAMLLICYAIPAHAISAQQTYAAFAQYEQVLNSKSVTRASLEQALGGVNKAVGAYAQTSRSNTPLGKTDVLLSRFQGVALKLTVVTVQATQSGDVDRARRTVRETMQGLREVMGSR